MTTAEERHRERQTRKAEKRESIKDVRQRVKEEVEHWLDDIDAVLNPKSELQEMD